jgi:hypothetical protein
MIKIYQNDWQDPHFEGDNFNLHEFFTMFAGEKSSFWLGPGHFDGLFGWPEAWRAPGAAGRPFFSGST